jgi:hypothetical protein
MSVYEQWQSAFNNKDIDAATALLHEDYTFVRHQSGTTMNKTQMLQMMSAFMANDSIVIKNPRCLYENNEVFVEHSVIDFPDGSTEALLSFYRLKEGQIIHAETGATLLKK